MNPNRIEVGDTVLVTYPGHPRPNRSFQAVVEHMPMATGDSWVFKSCQSGINEIYYISEGITVLLLRKGGQEQ